MLELRDDLELEDDPDGVFEFLSSEFVTIALLLDLVCLGSEGWDPELLEDLGAFG
jgi:hypothetical protein